MKSDSIAFGVAGMVFGLIAGWIIGSQQATLRRPEVPNEVASAPIDASAAALFDQAKVDAFTSVAEREPSNAAARVQLGTLYFDAKRYDDAIKWYTEAMELSPNDVRVSTDLGVAYYYTNQPDRSLQQLDRSLKIDPKHARTWLSVGIVKAFGKQDLEGAQAAWQQVLQIAPDSPEGQAAKRALDSMQSAHPSGAATSKPGV